MRLTTCLVFNLLFAAAAFSETVPTSPPQVEFFSPQGTVKSVRQVAARFSDPMVAFGDPRQKLAFTSRSSFTARFSCRRVKPEAECLPMLPIMPRLWASTKQLMTLSRI